MNNYKFIWRYEFPPGSPDYGKSKEHHDALVQRMGTNPNFFRVIDETACNLLDRMSHTIFNAQGTNPGTVKYTIDRLTRPYGNHLHDYASIVIYANEEHIQGLEEEVLKTLGPVLSLPENLKQ